MEKTALRAKYKALRSELSSKEIEERSLKIANNCLQLSNWDKTYYHIFLPIPGKGEVNTEYLLHILHGKDKSVLVPKVMVESSDLAHILLQENTRLVSSSYGVPEPVEGLVVPPKNIDVVFVPLLAYDKHGHRVGYGKGFYDRFLNQCSSEAVFVGLSFFEPEDFILTEIIDIPLHFCVTPKKMYRF